MKLIDADDFIKKFSYAEANTEEENTMCATVRRMINGEIRIMSALQKKTDNRTLVKRWNNIHGQMQ